MNRPKYRIRAYSKLQKDYGYVGYYLHYYQDLQIARWYGWQTIDREEVPAWVKINIAILGDDAGWRSKFAHTHSSLFKRIPPSP